MAQILGWIGTTRADEQEVARAAIRKFAQPTPHGVSSIFAEDGGFGAGVRGPAAGMHCGSHGSTFLAYVGRPCWADGREVDAPTLAAKFAADGHRTIESLGGAFSIAWFDSRRNEGLAATDRMGVHPLFFAHLREGFAFASAPTDLNTLSGAKRTLSSQAIFDYLFCHVVPAPHSIFEDVRRLLPGECVILQGSSTRLHRYWQARFDESRRADFASLRTDFLTALRTSVEGAMQGAACGAFLSGGTDSSTIAGMMTQIAGKPAETFSIGFEAAGYDEMEYARLASRHFGTHHHEYYVTPRDIVAALPTLASTHAQPFGNASALPTYFCARLAREHGVERLLGGDGGDELFGGNARYAKQRAFQFYERVPLALRKALIEPACSLLARGPRLPVLGKAVSYVTQASVPLPERLDSYNLLQRVGYAEVLSETFLDGIDRDDPLRLNRDAYLNPTAGTQINRMLALDFKTTLADNDLPKVMQSCELAEMQVVFPLLDTRVVDFSLALEPTLKLKGVQLRWFFKEALRDFLPIEIIQKEKHGFGLPFGEWAMRDPALRAFTFDALNAFKRRDIARPAFIDRLKDEFLPQYPNYYGTLAWVFMMLELWLHSHFDSVSTTPLARSSHVEPA